MPNTRISVDHRRLRCNRSFQETHNALVGLVPALKRELFEMLAQGDGEGVAKARREGPALWLFEMRDHGALTAVDGMSSKAMQYEIGNPMTAERMTRYVLAAGLYAPLRVLLYEAREGDVFFEYDLPSTLFGQFGDARVTAVGLELDSELETVLRAAGGAATL